MAFNLTALTSYVDQHSFELISKAVLNTDLMNNIAIRPGLRAGTVNINLFDGIIDPKDAACGFVSSATASFSVVPIVIKDKEIKQTLCPQDLRDYWTSESLSPSANLDSVPFEETMANFYVQKIREYNEGYLINGDGSANGIKQQVATASGSTLTATASFTATTAFERCLELYEGVKESVKNRNDIILVMSPERYRLLIRNLLSLNLYHYKSVESNIVVDLPGTNAKVVMSSGLIGSNYMFAGPAGFIVAGVGLEGDFDRIRLFYDEGEDIVKMMAKWRLGVAVYQPEVFATNGAV